MGRQDFNRYELKFVIESKAASRLRKDLKSYLRPDPYCREAPRYKVTSIYYDSTQRDFYWHKVDSLEHRRKVRIRFYGDDPSRSFLEIKEKHRSTIAKRRIEIGPATDTGHALDKLGGNDEISREVRWLDSVYDLEPAVGISYQRQALVGGDDFNRLRVTFDSSLCCGDPFGGAVQQFDRRFLRPDLMILEVKVNEFLPRWSVRFLQRHGLFQTRYSKYCSGLATWLDQSGQQPLAPGLLSAAAHR